MSSVNLLGDYKILYDTIFDNIKQYNSGLDLLNNLQDSDVENYLNNLKGNIDTEPNSVPKNSTAYTYLNNILTEINNINIFDDDQKSKFVIKAETIKRKKNTLKLLQIVLIGIFGGLGLYIIYKTFNPLGSNNIEIKNENNIIKNNPNISNNSVKQFRESKDNRTSLMYSKIDNLSYGLVLLYIAYVIHYNFKYYIELANIEYAQHLDIKNRELRKIDNSIDGLKNVINKIKCDTSSTTTGTEFKEQILVDGTINLISENIIGFNNNYNLLSSAALDNRLSKENKIKDINIIFDNYKEIIYKQNNRFDNIIVDNEKNIVCLMNILLYLEQPDNINENIICNLNNSDGLKGFVEKQRKAQTSDDVFSNGIENIDQNQANILYDKITSDILDESNKFELMNMDLFKVIVNLFKIKIYKYKIKKHDFILYIYSHFENMNLENNNINISKFDIINNYKTIINIIYSEYETYRKIKVINKDIPRYQIDLNKFNEIMNQTPLLEVEENNRLLLNTIDKINEFKDIHGKEIYNDINKEKRFNKSLEYLIYLSIIITFLQVYKLSYSNNFKENFVEDAIDVTKYLAIALLFNSVILSYWYKITTNTDYSEMVIHNSDNIFLKELSSLNEKIKKVETIKNLDLTNNDLINLLNEKNIIVSLNATGEKIYAQNMGEEKIILEYDDVKNIIYEEYYIQLTKVIHIHECCTFLSGKRKIPVFPWTDFTINLLFYIIIFLIVFNIFFINDDLNPFTIITNLKSRLLVNRTDVNKLKEAFKNVNSNKVGGATADKYKNEIFKQKNLVNLLVIYLCLLYIYKIYESSFNYNANLFR